MDPSSLHLHRQPMPPALLRMLKFSSWIATLLLVLYHVRYLVLANYASAGAHSVWVDALYFVTGLGHQAFTIFFVTQGFVLARTLAVRRAAGQLAYAPVLINKAVRIYAMLLPVLLLGLVLDSAGSRYLHGGGAAIYHAYPDFSVLTLDAPTLLGQLVMGQPWLVPTFGSNGVLWMLGCAWWYGCAFLLVFYLSERASWLGMLLCAALAWLAMQHFPSEAVAWALIFLLGAAVVPLSTRSRNVPRLPAVLVFATALILSRYMESHSAMLGGEAGLRFRFLKDFIFGIGVAWLLLSVSVTPGRRRRSWAGRLADRLSDDIDRFSCTLFFGHFPVLMFAAALANAHGGMALKDQPGPRALLWLVLLSAAVYLLGWVYYQLGERHAGSLVRSVLFNTVRRHGRAALRHGTGNETP